MGSLHNSCSNLVDLKQRQHFSPERRPRLLKDFLFDDSNSCSSNWFKSFPRKVPSDSAMRILIEMDFNVPKNGSNSSSTGTDPRKLIRSRSRAAALTTISAFQAFINAVKNIPFSAAKPPSILPRSLSRRLSKRKGTENIKGSEIKSRVTVKDIIRWRSFRDLVEEEFPTSDFPPSPNHHTADADATTTSASTVTTPCSSSNSNGSSWCDSDFTSEYLPEEDSENGVVEVGKKNLPCVGGFHSVKATTEIRAAYTTTNCTSKIGQAEKRSLVSVIDLEDEEASSPGFNQTLATMETASTKQKLMQKIWRSDQNLARMEPLNLERRMSSMEENTSSASEEEESDEEVEEKAWQLLNHVKTTTSLGRSSSNNADQLLLLDFFRDELGITRNTKRDQRRNFEFYGEIIEKAEGWINGDDRLWVGWEEKHRREAHVVEMNKGGMWGKFEEEQEELVLAIEYDMFGVLVDELLIDIFSS